MLTQWLWGCCVRTWSRRKQLLQLVVVVDGSKGWCRYLPVSDYAYAHALLVVMFCVPGRGGSDSRRRNSARRNPKQPMLALGGGGGAGGGAVIARACCCRRCVAESVVAGVVDSNVEVRNFRQERCDNRESGYLGSQSQ